MIGQIRGGQIGSISFEFEHRGTTSPFTHEQTHRADTSWESRIPRHIINARMALLQRVGFLPIRFNCWVLAELTNARIVCLPSFASKTTPAINSASQTVRQPQFHFLGSPSGIAHPLRSATWSCNNFPYWDAMNRWYSSNSASIAPYGTDGKLASIPIRSRGELFRAWINSLTSSGATTFPRAARNLRNNVYSCSISISRIVTLDAPYKRKRPPKGPATLTSVRLRLPSGELHTVARAE